LIAIVQTSFSSKREAKHSANLLLENSYCACCKIIGPVDSMYRWKDSICSEKEYILHIKTTEKAISTVIKAIEECHPYDCPEILVIPIITSSEGYKHWVKKEVKLPD
jgi:periplasmic divalent cation tolerance protein